MYEPHLAQIIHPQKITVTQEGREYLTTHATYSLKHKLETVPEAVTILKTSRLWQCVARNVSPSILKNLHPANVSLSYYSQNAHGHNTKELQHQQHHCNNLITPTSPK